MMSLDSNTNASMKHASATTKGPYSFIAQAIPYILSVECSDVF